MHDRSLRRDIAITGYGCRLPGARDAGAFWRLLTEGRCAIGEIGPDRWSAASFLSDLRGAPGTTYTVAAGVLDDPFGFDPAVFGLSPREAAQMDPQQRLLLMAAWEAVAMDGAAPAAWGGARTGVYVGASGLDYGNTFFGDPASGDSPFMTGNTLSIIANRIAHVFDARGPSYVVDTACSSSLFAFHAACEAIRSGAIDRAIVGGSNLLLSPMPFVGFSRAGMLSPRGLCTPFDAGADGYVRAEGVVAFTLSAVDAPDAALTPDGGRVRGVVLGSGVNSDGRASALSVPNGAEQATLMASIYEGAGVDPDALAFIEAHGTGTSVGDPIEAAAIGQALGRRRAAPLPVGSVKSNIGHLEPASGLAGLLKAQLALEHGLLPATLHVAEPNPAIDFEGLNLAIATGPRPLVRDGAPLAAGVNSFGFGGANAHVAIRQPDAEAAAAPTAAPGPLVLSAATRESLVALATAWRDRLRAADDAQAAALANHAAYRSPTLPRRLVAPASDRAAQIAALDAFAAGAQEGPFVEATGALSDAPVAFVFSGNGAQWPGMGLAPYAEDAAFRDSLDATAALIVEEGGPDVVAAMHAGDLAERLTQAIVAQPLLMALQIATVDALAARGVAPAAVAGHSVGEVAAACVAGAIDRRAAARLTVRRARRQAPLYGEGAMAAALADRDRTMALIAEAGLEGVDIAADNSPRGVTVSGDTAAIDAFCAAARERRLAVRRLKVEYPFHGPMMERIREGLLADLADFRGAPTRLPFVSTTLGRLAEGEEVDGGYWWRNARQPVLFREAVLALHAQGARVFLEIGPQPTLQNYVADTLGPTGGAFVALPSLRRQGAGGGDVALAAARVVAAGGAVDRARLHGPRAAAPADPPAYPWTLAPYRAARTPDALNVLRDPAPHPLLGWRAFGGDPVWRASVDPETHRWLGDHLVDGAPVMPAAALFELALAAAAQALGDGPVELTDVDVAAALTLSRGARTELRTTLDPATGVVTVESKASLSEGPWTLHARGRARRADAAPAAPIPAPAAADPAAAAALYEALDAAGLRYGPAFRRLAAVAAPAEGEAEGALSPSLTAGAWRLDPTSLDAAFHLVAALVGAEAGAQVGARDVCYVPVRAGRLRVRGPGATHHAKAWLRRRGARSVVADVALYDADGAEIASAAAMRFAAVRLTRRRDPAEALWRETLRPARRHPDQVAATPAAWRDPARRLIDIGAASREAPEPDDGQLIVGAMVRRIVWDAATALAPDGGVTLLARKALAPGAYRALRRGLTFLEGDGCYDRAADRVSAEAPGPTLDALCAALAVAAPERAGDMMQALRLARALSRDGDAAAGAAGGGDDRARRAAWAALTPALEDLLRSWPADAPLEVALIGAPPAQLADMLDRRASRLSLHADAEAAAVEARRFDVVAIAGVGGEALTAEGAAEALLAAGGVALIADAARDPLAALDDALTAAPSRAAPASETGGPLFAAGKPVEVTLRAACPRAAQTPASEPLADAALHVLAPPDGTTAAPLARRLRAAGVATEIATAPDALDPAAGAVAVLVDAAAAAPAETMMRLRSVVERIAAGRVWLTLIGPAPDAAATALARARRVFANEYAGRVEIGVIEAEDDAGAAAALVDALDPRDPEREIVMRGAARFARRVEPAGDVALLAARRAAGADAGLALAADPLGGLGTLRWRPFARRAPGPGEIEIAVAASGLNFRDVMWAMGALPEEAVEDGFAGARLGMECAGVVTRAGQGARYVEGDRVIAFAAGALASHVTLSDGAAAAMPEGLSFAAAATLPVVFGTAWRSLVDLGRLERGERVLIHGGAGGVGLAALQIARARGAEVIATAGTPEKRSLLRLFGAGLALDSRGLGFADAALAATDGRGVDVALNSLAGEAMERTLEVMAPFGRFIELGKRDYYANTQIGLRPLRRNISYFGVDLDAMLKARPDSGGRLLREVSRSVADGELSALPHSRLEADDAVAAFRLMQRAGHVGKIVLAPPAAPAEAAAPPPPLARADGAYLVVGGARGLGLRFAGRLAARGARRIWLTSRGGACDEAGVAALRARGVEVTVAACDAADETATAALLRRIDGGPAPLRGVALAAMALDDATLVNLTAARIEAVLRPKLKGGAVLDALTRGHDLDFFVLFSSVSVLFGNPGQAAYVAANAGLEAIAAARRARGAPALAMGFGPIADAGVLAEDAKARERLERRGAGVLTADAALDALELALAGDDHALTAAPMRWGALAGEIAVIGEPLFERAPRAAEDAADADAGRDIAAMLAGLDDAAAVRKLTGLLVTEAAAILRQPVEEIDPSRPLADLGFDSLMGMELKLSAEEKYGVALPALSLGDGATLTGIAARIVSDLRRGPAAPAADATLDALAARHVDDAASLDAASLVSRAAALAEGQRS